MSAQDLPATARAISVVIAIALVATAFAPLLFTAFNNRYWAGGLDEPTTSQDPDDGAGILRHEHERGVHRPRDGLAMGRIVGRRMDVRAEHRVSF